ncbi:protein Z-dependent protease inhibitor [Echinops telfairi]|uniref:Protein Z-dependent protease inhibitor n=1 Tax=Echinops telfairi TaxID=9371 RepID=A0ABM0IFV3_ECHTE|nr:protein Z-dependent protease inhibitor [Echinops telfairi]
MKVMISLLLPVLLAQGDLVPSSTLSPPQSETEAGPSTPKTLVPQNQPPQEEEEEEARLVAGGFELSRATSNLGFDLLRKMTARHEGNLMFSPLGLSFAMGTLMLGTSGPTHAQILSGLGLQTLSRTQPLPELFGHLRKTLTHTRELGLSQGSWAFIHKDFDVTETFRNLSKRYFDTECVPVNFRNASQARGLMNHYISKETQGKIPKLFDKINPDTKLILMDYILFRGKWQTPFNPAFTEVDTFHLDKYRAVKVPLMFASGTFASSFDVNLRCHVLKLPYRGNATMLVVLMQRLGDYLALEDYLTTDLVEAWLQNMKTRKMEVFFPKFKLDQKYEMHHLLKQMGIQRIFSPWADLSELSPTPRNLKVSEVLQRTVVEVDEQGTEAAAGTLTEITAYSMPPIIKVDRPFHFLIYEETTRLLLFLGRVVDPTRL